MTRKLEDGLGGSLTIFEHGSATTPMRFRTVMPKGLGPPAPEHHPSQTEDFIVLRGVLDLGIVQDRHVVLRAGDTFHLPAGVYHHPANAGDDELEFDAVLTPGLESGDMFIDLCAVMREHRGIARFARVSMVLQRDAKMISFKPPVRMVMRIVAALARVLGVTLPASRAFAATGAVHGGAS
jgi:mannose-6-phosphate isomerase-like protein (cupin superfamily)